MADQKDKDGGKKERHKADKRVIKTADYTGPDRRKSERRVINEGSEPQE